MFRFQDLPPELRDQIWDLALQQEAHDRLLITCRDNYACPFHIVPFKHNASPFLSVNSESRYRALLFYTVKLPVYEAPPHVARLTIKSDSARYCYFEQIRTAREEKGVLYINPQQDIFVVFESFDEPLVHLAARENDKAPWMVPFRYITRFLLDGASEQVRNVVCVEKTPKPWSDDYKRAGLNPIIDRIKPKKIEDLWGTVYFKDIKNYLYLRLTPKRKRYLFYNIIKHGGRRSYNFRELVVCRDDSVPGCWALFDLHELRRLNRKRPLPELRLKPYHWKDSLYGWKRMDQVENYDPSSYPDIQLPEPPEE